MALPKLCFKAELHFRLKINAAGDELWGNIYGKDCLARIDKTSGSVTGWLVLDGILDRQRRMPIHSELRSL